MQPVIEVQCPFCNARGQIMTPPIGAIIVGPCPRCDELVLLFGGAVLPLDKEIILQGAADEKKAHITEAIMDMVVERVGDLVDKSEEQADTDAEDPGTDDEVEDAPAEGVAPSVGADHPVDAITEAEVRDFVDIDLHLIDRKAHFEKIFGTR